MLGAWGLGQRMSSSFSYLHAGLPLMSRLGLASGLKKRSVLLILKIETLHDMVLLFLSLILNK